MRMLSLLMSRWIRLLVCRNDSASATSRHRYATISSSRQKLVMRSQSAPPSTASIMIHNSRSQRKVCMHSVMLGCLLNAIIAISFSRAGMFVCLPISNLFKAILLPSERRSPIYTDPEEPSPAFLRLLIWFRGFSNLNWTASLEAALKSFALGGAGLVQPAERNSRMSSTICGFLIVSSLPIPEDFKICLHSSGNPLNPVESLGSTWTCVMCCKLYGREMPCSSCFLDKLRVI
mmetsp:Transcript_3095/g.10422  ORF Transcript_3095/g.10422 Transcript_3095/m.10422 type:complete len:233 (-) Transcript_3095:226-924(-)